MSYNTVWCGVDMSTSQHNTLNDSATQAITEINVIDTQSVENALRKSRNTASRCNYSNKYFYSLYRIQNGFRIRNRSQKKNPYKPYLYFRCAFVLLVYMLKSSRERGVVSFGVIVSNEQNFCNS
jgi:hypothetical protein